jgi:hypothetical protein
MLSARVSDAAQEEAGAAGAVLDGKKEWMVNADFDGFGATGCC